MSLSLCSQRLPVPQRAFVKASDDEVRAGRSSQSQLARFHPTSHLKLLHYLTDTLKHCMTSGEDRNCQLLVPGSSCFPLCLAPLAEGSDSNKPVTQLLQTAVLLPAEELLQQPVLNFLCSEMYTAIGFVCFSLASLTLH